MPKTGLEPARIAPYAPQAHVSTNSTTWAFNYYELKFNFLKDRFAGRIAPTTYSAGAGAGAVAGASVPSSVTMVSVTTDSTTDVAPRT